MPVNDSVFRPAIESAPTGMLVCDQAGIILFANRQIEHTFGYTVAELLDRPIERLLPVAKHTAHQRAPAASWANPGTLRVRAGGDFTGRRKDGSEVPVEVGVTVVEHEGQELVIASVVDITDRLNLQRELGQNAGGNMAFERLVTDLTARFVSVKADEIEGTILDSLRQICEVLDVDRSTWWRFEGDSRDAIAVYSWTRPEFHVVASGESLVVRLPFQTSKLRNGEAIFFDAAADLSDDTERDTMRTFQTKSGVGLPFVVDGKAQAVLGFSAIRKARTWPPEVIDRLRLVSAVIGQTLSRRESEDRLHRALDEVRQLRDRLAVENVHLRREATVLTPHHALVADSSAVKQVLKQIESVAPTNATVLLLGETGSGKEVFAQAIHRCSDRHPRPMVTVNCAAIPATLIESELFGRERGAFTGALARQIGRFELASGSTIFLDEVGELPLESQVKLLRVLQERVIERLGGGQSIKVDVRIVAATNRDLEKAVEERLFREDLYYRLNVFPITIPPLRERLEDIPALVWTFIDEFSQAFHKSFDSISADSLAVLRSYSWPGNVRELRNVIERAIIVASGPTLVIEQPRSPSHAKRRAVRLEDVEADHIRGILQSVNWRVRGRGGAAELLGVKPNTLDSRMAKLGIVRPD